MIIYGNDTYFSSDGSGITGSLELGMVIDQWHSGLGFFVASPEVLKDKRPNNDPLPSLGRMNIWLGKNLNISSITQINVSGRVGLEGGTIDDIGFKVQNALHSIVNQGSRHLVSTKEMRALTGISSWIRSQWASWKIKNSSIQVTPYTHASLGNDTIEAGAGLMLALQAAGEPTPLFLSLPKNGSYAPSGGGEGIGLFIGARKVYHESLFDNLHRPSVTEAGLVWQKNIFSSTQVSSGVSCTSKAYDGAVGTDCKADLRLNYSWSK
jgi:hypothetical protein